MTIKITDDRRPLGHVTWVAILRDGTSMYEFYSEIVGDPNLPENELWWSHHPQVSFDRVAERDDVAEVHLIPFMQGEARSYVKIVVQPGERVEKKWIRTFTVNSDDPNVQSEHAVIDAFTLISDKPVRHFSFADGSILITTDTEPPR